MIDAICCCSDLMKSKFSIAVLSLSGYCMICVMIPPFTFTAIAVSVWLAQTVVFSFSGGFFSFGCLMGCDYFHSLNAFSSRS